MNEPKEERTASTSRLINARPKAVFQAIVTPDLLQRWWGPKGFTNTFNEIDVRTGGKWTFTMHGPNGANYPNENVFEEVTENERVAIRHVSHPHFVLTISLTEQGDQTLLHWNQEFETVSDFNKVKAIVVTANEENLDRLEDVL